MEERILQILEELYKALVKEERDPNQEPWPVMPNQLRDEVERYE